MTNPEADRIIGLYERHADLWDAERSRSTLFERPWLQKFEALLKPGGSVLDIGCGAGEPIAGYFVRAGYEVHGVDSSPAMIERCQTRFPKSTWAVADMRTLALGRTFDGIIAWDSFFHLTADDQRAMFPRFAAHARPGAPLMFTSGSRAGTAIGDYHGEPLHHASLDLDEYRRLLTASRFDVDDFVLDDPECGGHTVWLTVQSTG